VLVNARSFSHVGITVSNFNRFVQFYSDVFGCRLVGVADTPPDRVRTFFGVDGQLPRCTIGWVRVPGGGILEIFEFQPQLPPAAIPWNRVGLTHFSFNVRNTDRWYAYLTSKGVECVSRPERSPRGHTFFFARDFDGNLIEMIDLGYMHWVLKFFGPLGGWLFRRGMYKHYYRPQA
jgi:catechol 2,3-dioxygenase-like lactoylglutathione lyase family enzyme